MTTFLAQECNWFFERPELLDDFLQIASLRLQADIKVVKIWRWELLSDYGIHTAAMKSYNATLSSLCALRSLTHLSISFVLFRCNDPGFVDCVKALVEPTSALSETCSVELVFPANEERLQMAREAIRSPRISLTMY